jgi:hypothetical protein
MTLPNLIRARDGGIGTGPFIYTLSFSIVPFLLVSIRNKSIEMTGWCIQLVVFIAVLAR